MTPTEPGFNADELQIIRNAAEWRGANKNLVTVDPASILALLDEVERLQERQESADLVNEAIRHKARANTAFAERDAALAEVKQWKRDGECHCTTEPEETCPRDGRTYTEWVERGDVLQAERDALRAKVAAVEGDEIAWEVAKVSWDRSERDYWNSERDMRPFDPAVTELDSDQADRGRDWLETVTEVLTDLRAALAEGSA